VTSTVCLCEDGWLSGPNNAQHHLRSRQIGLNQLLSLISLAFCCLSGDYCRKFDTALDGHHRTVYAVIDKSKMISSQSYDLKGILTYYNAIALGVLWLLMNYAWGVLRYHSINRSKTAGVLPPRYPSIIPYLGTTVQLLYDTRGAISRSTLVRLMTNTD
jgi:hypothetical protein